jgi:dihydropteroate synthase
LLPDGAAVADRDEPTAIVSALAAQAGVWAVRVHNVRATRIALDVVRAWQAGSDDQNP